MAEFRTFEQQNSKKLAKICTDYFENKQNKENIKPADVTFGQIETTKILRSQSSSNMVQETLKSLKIALSQQNIEEVVKLRQQLSA